ncbi:hypothetical protein ACNS7O_01380 [Haloferacaceae archaeon DSL9]
MITVEETEFGLRVTDAAKKFLDVRCPSWTATEAEHTIPRPIDATVSGSTTALRFPSGFVTAEALDGAETFQLGGNPGPLSLPDRKQLCRISASILVYLRFDNSATISRPDPDSVLFAFPEPTAVTIGFRSRIKAPTETITIPRTLDGVATALSLLPRANQTTTPDRSFPTMRDHPPLITFGAEYDLPTGVDPGYSETNIEFRMPPDLSYLLTGSSLAHYLGATVSVENVPAPELHFADSVYAFEPLPNFEMEAASLLRRVFWLDCLVRNAGPHGTDLAEADLLADLSIDPGPVYHRSLDQRLSIYLDTPFERISSDLPEWHLSMYLDADFGVVRSLPYLLYTLPNVFLAQSSTLPSEEWLSRSLDDFYRARDAPSVDLLQPELRTGRVHGWLAEGAPIDVFKAVPEAYENRAKYYDRADETISIVAILNETEMSDEHTEAADIYRERADELGLDVTVRENLSRSCLASVFRANHDFVHYIGHCEEDGLRCRDGNLSIDAIEESNAQTFFLNACGSYYEGVSLVEKGSIAGAATFNRVLDKDAARVGTTFAKLLVHGYSVEEALDYARRRVMTGKDYIAVGDGTHTLVQAEDFVSGHTRLTKRGPESFEIVVNAYAPWTTGGYYQSNLNSDTELHLHGSPRTYLITKEELTLFLDTMVLPIIYDGDLRWPEKILEELD